MKSNLAEQKQSEALSAGCDLWIVLNNPDSLWWQKINFNSGFLFSTLTESQKNSFTQPVPIENINILNKTNFPAFNYKSNSKVVFIGTENHFLNRWICLIESVSDLESKDFLSNLKNLQVKRIRCFFDASDSPSLKASFATTEFVSGSH